MTTKTTKTTIRENSYGNWYGYNGGRRVASFFNSSTETQQERAFRWLRSMRGLAAATPGTRVKATDVIVVWNFVTKKIERLRTDRDLVVPTDTRPFLGNAFIAAELDGELLGLTGWSDVIGIENVARKRFGARVEIAPQMSTAAYKVLFAESGCSFEPTSVDATGGPLVVEIASESFNDVAAVFATMGVTTKIVELK